MVNKQQIEVFKNESGVCVALSTHHKFHEGCTGMEDDEQQSQLEHRNAINDHEIHPFHCYLMAGVCCMQDVRVCA